jgi:hypothetical protein
MRVHLLRLNLRLELPGLFAGSDTHENLNNNARIDY